ncbi:hypothetical protein ES332_A03G003800v1 [Gossypium tomentosum]|uniref:S-protein homolog n=1 Tax=Gossypium tomentosum TaxID=34277 RepID=A0A5D2R3I9_GOSTO|nr:hypothetical protein ES332_A03G003800v1 [Gossypium tomentosum]
MLAGNHKFIGFTFLITFQLLSFSIRSSAFLDNIFPTVTVTLINEASHSVYLKCGFDESGEYKGLQKMEPGDSITWSFVELIFPLRWCYIHIDEETYGAFWAFTVFLQCHDCQWIIRDDSAYHFNHYYDVWKKTRLFFQY